MAWASATGESSSDARAESRLTHATACGLPREGFPDPGNRSQADRRGVSRSTRTRVRIGHYADRAGVRPASRPALSPPVMGTVAVYRRLRMDQIPQADRARSSEAWLDALR